MHHASSPYASSQEERAKVSDDFKPVPVGKLLIPKVLLRRLPSAAELREEEFLLPSKASLVIDESFDATHKEHGSDHEMVLTFAIDVFGLPHSFPMDDVIAQCIEPVGPDSFDRSRIWQATATDFERAMIFSVAGFTGQSLDLIFKGFARLLLIG